MRLDRFVSLGLEAADEIERLRAGLEKISTAIMPNAVDSFFVKRLQEIARKVLEK